MGGPDWNFQIGVLQYKRLSFIPRNAIILLVGIAGDAPARPTNPSYSSPSENWTPVHFSGEVFWCSGASPGIRPGKALRFRV